MLQLIVEVGPGKSHVLLVLLLDEGQSEPFPPRQRLSAVGVEGCGAVVLGEQQLEQSLILSVALLQLLPLEVSFSLQNLTGLSKFLNFPQHDFLLDRGQIDVVVLDYVNQFLVFDGDYLELRF